MECPRCKKECEKLVRKNRAGDDINLCRNCYAYFQYAIRKPYPVRRKGETKLQCEHQAKWRNGMKVCTTCYNAFWRENTSNICGGCGRLTKRSINPKCDRCLGKKIIRDLTDSEKTMMRIFLVKGKQGLISPIDRLRMLNLYLEMGLYWKTIEAMGVAETEEYILETFRGLV